MPQSSKTLNDITESDLIKALQDAIAAQQDTEPGTITRSEWEQAQGVTEYTARKQLGALKVKGILKPAWVVRTNDWNETQRIKGYRYVGSLIDDNANSGPSN